MTAEQTIERRYMKQIKTLNDVKAGLNQLLKIDDRLVKIAHAAGPPPLRLQEPGFAGLARIVIDNCW